MAPFRGLLHMDKRIMMWTVISTIISKLISSVGDSFSMYQERKQAQHQTALAIEMGKQKIIEKQIERRYELSVAQLNATPRWFKVLSFVFWFIPFVVIILSPASGAAIFDNLKQAPQWYVETSIALMFTVWGIAISRETVAGVFSGISRYMRKGQELRFKRKLFYNVVRENTGGLTQNDVVLYEKAIEVALRPDKEEDTQ